MCVCTLLKSSSRPPTCTAALPLISGPPFLLVRGPPPLSALHLSLLISASLISLSRRLFLPTNEPSLHVSPAAFICSRFSPNPPFRPLLSNPVAAALPLGYPRYRRSPFPIASVKRIENQWASAPSRRHLLGSIRRDASLPYLPDGERSFSSVDLPQLANYHTLGLQAVCVRACMR